MNLFKLALNWVGMIIFVFVALICLCMLEISKACNRLLNKRKKDGQ